MLLISFKVFSQAPTFYAREDMKNLTEAKKYESRRLYIFRCSINHYILKMFLVRCSTNLHSPHLKFLLKLLVTLHIFWSSAALFWGLKRRQSKHTSDLIITPVCRALIHQRLLLKAATRNCYSCLLDALVPTQNISFLFFEIGFLLPRILAPRASASSCRYSRSREMFKKREKPTNVSSGIVDCPSQLILYLYLSVICF